MAIVWEPSMTTGLPDIDKQHQQLIRATNDLMEALAQGKARQEVGRILDFLNDYATEHFAKEEAYMAKYKCPAALSNKLAHSNFVKTFGELHERFHKEGSSAALALEVRRNLADWLVSHIRGVDTQLAAYVPKQAG